MDPTRGIASIAAEVRQVFTPKASRLALLPLVATAVWLRDPSLFRSPRFWAEEGTNYFSSALRGPWFEALTRLRTTPHAAYLNPIPHLATFVAARFGPLEWAPAITTGTWCAFFLAVEIGILYGRSALLAAPWRRALALVVPLLVTNNGENWANTIGVHYLCDFALVLLLLEAPLVSGWRRRANLVAVAVFALASQTNFLLLPAVAFLFWRNPAAYRPYFKILASTAIFSLMVAFVLHEPGVRPENDLVAVPHILLLKFVIWPFAGWDAADAYGALTLTLDRASFELSASIVALSLAALAVAVYFAFRWDDTSVALMIAYVATIAAYSVLGLGVGRGHLSTYNAGRYAWLPNAIALMLLLNQIDLSKLRAFDRKHLAFASLLTAALVVGVLDYRHPTAPHGPSWRREVRHFRQDPTYAQLRIAPTGWVVDMPPALPRLP